MLKSKENSKYILYHKHCHIENTLWPTKKDNIDSYQQVFFNTLSSFRLEKGVALSMMDSLQTEKHPHIFLAEVMEPV